MREEFERWFMYNYSWFVENDKGCYHLERFKDHPHQYVSEIAHHDFRVWTASREHHENEVH
jgi:hypothetical protein